MSREGQRGRRRSNFAVRRNRLNPFNRDSLVRNWTQPTGLVPFQETSDPFWGGNGVGYNATGNTSTNTAALQLPSVNDGDLNILFINVASGTNLTDPGPMTLNGTALAAQGSTNADGWLTVVTAYDDGSPGTRLTVVAKVFATGDSTTFQWAWSIASNYAGGGGWVQAGTFDATNPIPSADIQSQVSASTSYPTPSITTSVRGVIMSVAGCRTNGAWTPDLGDTRRFTEMRSSTSNIAFADAVVPVDAGTYSRTWTNTASTAQANLGIFLVASATAASVASATVATGSGTANDATVAITAAPAAAAVTGAANAATTDSTSFITGGNTGNSTGPSVTFPSTIASGQVITLMLMLNNTDNITASPTELTTLDSAALSGSGQGTSYLYRMLADGTTASSTLSWTLAATRNWSIAYVAHSDVDQDPANPYVGFGSASDAVTATTSFTAPSATSTGTGYALEFMGVKGNGTAIGDLTAPSGWTERQQVLNTNTFGSNIAIATRNGNPVAAGTYGGDVWSTDVSATTSFRYTIVLPQTPGVAAATADALTYDAGVAVTVLPAEAAATGSAAWDAGDTVDTIAVGDNPIFATGTAYDATVSTAVTTTATPSEAAATGAANDAAALVTPNATEATATGAANNAAAVVTAADSGAAATGTANNPTALVTPAATEATATGTAPDAAALVTPVITEAAATGTANDATVVTGSNTTAPATEATGTGAALDGIAAITPAATEATSTGTANDTTSAIVGNAAEATATGAALDATVTTSANGTANAAEATAVGAAFDAIIAVSFTPAEATALAAAADALSRITVAPVEAVATGTAYAPRSIPDGRAEGAAAASESARAGSPAVALIEAPRPAAWPAGGSDGAAPAAGSGNPTTPRAGG